MKQFKNFGTIERQSYLEEFVWNKKKYFSYLIKFEEHEGLFKINRCSEYEQALIGGKLIFNVNQDLTRISNYRILGFKEIHKDKIESTKNSK